VKNKNLTESQNLQLSKRMIESAVIMDENLAELLKVETKRMKKLINTNPSTDELIKINTLIKNIIYAMTLTDEKIKNGIKLLELTENE